MKRKYNTEEERKAARKAYNAKYYQSNKEKIAKQKAEYYQDNKEKILEQKVEYYQDNKEKKAAYNAEYYQTNKEKIAEQRAEYNAEYYSTPKGRANSLVNGYRRLDKNANRGECTLTADWIAEHIFSQPCHYCGETDWHELGCDRIDNTLPHAPENVVPCCYHCNCKKGVTPYDEYMRLIGKIA